MGCGITYKNLRNRIDMKELLTDPNIDDGKETYVEPVINHRGFKDHSEDKNIPPDKPEFSSNAYHSEDLKNYSTSEEGKLTINLHEFYDFEGHAMKIFRIINKMRRHPQKFIKKLYYIISKIDKNSNIADLSEKYDALITLELPQPIEAIAFLQQVSPKHSLLWSIKYNIIAFDELEFSINPHVKYSTNLVSIPTTDIIRKIKTNFVYSPKLTVLLIFLLSEENRKLIFSDEYSIASVATLCYKDNKIIDTFNEKGNTLIYFIKSENNK